MLAQAAAVVRRAGAYRAPGCPGRPPRTAYPRGVIRARERDDERAQDGLPGWSIALRVAVLAALVVALVRGTLAMDDRAWPVGTMSMFAFSVDENGTVHSLGLEAITVSGQRVRVPLGRGGIGLERAEIEGQQERLVREPQRLQGVAVAQAHRRPHDERYRIVEIVDTVSQLRGGRTVGTPRRVVEATWRVVDPAAPRALS